MSLGKRPSWVWRATCVVAAVIVFACGPAPALRSPVVLIGVDGLEWEVILSLARAGHLPTLTRLMEDGTFGKLNTLTPTLSPIIWTTVATGKEPTKHGIKGFIKARMNGRSPDLYTNRDRRTKALWNILSDWDRSVHAIGWWATFPAEPVNGVMIAQTNTLGQISPGGPNVPWKGTVLQGLQGQVTPATLQNRVMEVAKNVEASLPQLARQVFGDFASTLPPASLRSWTTSQWSFRADNTYLQAAKQVLEDSEEGVPDLLMVYFGMPDVVGHLFWRHAFPADFDYPSTAEENDSFSGVVAKSYAWVDGAIGELLEFYDERTTVIIVSDHGMRSVNRELDFVGREGSRSGGHDDGLPGIMIISGGHARRGEAFDRWARGGRRTQSGTLQVLGSVRDVAPTVLALQGIPVGRDMDGSVLARCPGNGIPE